MALCIVQLVLEDFGSKRPYELSMTVKVFWVCLTVFLNLTLCFQWKCCWQFPVDICVSRAPELCQSGLAVHCYWLYLTWECVCAAARTQVREQHYCHLLYMQRQLEVRHLSDNFPIDTVAWLLKLSRLCTGSVLQILKNYI